MQNNVPTDGTKTAALPLDGITVVSVEQALAAPLASRQLADLGANVIKIERPDGGDFARHYDRSVKGMSSAFVWANRSKKSVALDLSHPRAGEVLDPLLERADVFLHNLKPTSVPALGLGSERLRASNPRLVVCDISGYGDAAGRFRDKKAYDLILQAEVGLVSITGTPEHPAKAGISVADIAAASFAFSGVLAALYERERTGVGRVLSVSLLDCLAEWMGHPMYYALFSGGQPQRVGVSHAIIAPYGPFRSGDGATVVLAVQNDREWARFCSVVLRRPDLAEDPRFADNHARVTNREELSLIIEAALVPLGAADVLALLDQAQIANGRLNDIEDFAAEYREAAPHRWMSVDSAAGPVDALVPPTLPRDAQARPSRIPELGEHTDEVLRWLGMTEARIEELRVAHTIGASL